MNTILQQDINDFVKSFDFTKNIEGSSFLITGGTGLIGSILIRCLLSIDSNINITIPVRNKFKALNLFQGNYNQLNIIETDLLDYLKDLKGDFQYIIHCASPTSGVFMTEYPVETYNLTIESTRLLLDYSCSHAIKSMVYVSSIEYYGQIYEDRIIGESVLGYIDSSSARSSYPLAKRSAEFMCTAYALEYKVPVKIARLTQTLGAGINVDDNRVFAQFARSIINSKDIILHTSGESAKPYCYTIDSIHAIFYILLLGNKGEAYNVANKSSYISIKDLAEYLCKKFNPQVKVCIHLQSGNVYAPTTKLRLDTSKLEKLGWQPRYSLFDMFDRLIKSLNQ